LPLTLPIPFSESRLSGGLVSFDFHEFTLIPPFKFTETNILESTHVMLTLFDFQSKALNRNRTVSDLTQPNTVLEGKLCCKVDNLPTCASNFLGVGVLFSNQNMTCHHNILRDIRDGYPMWIHIALRLAFNL
jgi:hypothetical protein